VGIALWITAGALASLIARLIRPAQPQSWWLEPVIALLAATILGFVATALDFGGWNEPDWRAAAFAFAGTLAVTAGARILRTRLFSRASAGAASRAR